MASFHHRKLPDSSTLLAGPVPPDEVGFPSDRLQIWYNHAEEAWVDPLPHAHQDSDECFIILQGRVVVEVEGERFTIGPREFCCFPRGVYHQVVEVPPQQKRSCFELRQSATKCISRNQTNRLLACKSDGFFGLTCTVSLRNPWDLSASRAHYQMNLFMFIMRGSSHLWVIFSCLVLRSSAEC